MDTLETLAATQASARIAYDAAFKRFEEAEAAKWAAQTALSTASAAVDKFVADVCSTALADCTQRGDP